MILLPPIYTLFPYTTLFRSLAVHQLRKGGSDQEGYFLANLPSLDTDSDESRSEEHTSELQSRQYLVCRLLLEKKKIHSHNHQYKLHYSKYVYTSSRCYSV